MSETTNRKSEPSTEWGLDQLDLEAYLERVGMASPGAPSRDLLFALHRAHVEAFPFENLEVFLGRPPSLELADLSRKLVHKRRGGYCFELNLLLAAVLERLGFRVDRLMARVVSQTEKNPPRTHMMMRVQVPGDEAAGAWIADAGLGYLRPHEPLPFVEEAVTDQNGWRYALARRDESAWTLRMDGEEGWKNVYTFTLEPQYPSDYRVSNHYTATHPSSPFVKKPLLGLVRRDQRILLNGTRISDYTVPAKSTSRDFAAEEFGDLLEGRFGIHLDSEDLVAATRRLRAFSEQGE